MGKTLIANLKLPTLMTKLDNLKFMYHNDSLFEFVGKFINSITCFSSLHIIGRELVETLHIFFLIHGIQ